MGDEKMNNTKEKKARLQVIISALAIIVLLVAEIYFIISHGMDWAIPIVIIGVLLLAAVAVLINAIMNISAEREAQRQAHYDNLYKSEKASYLMLKNRFEEIERKLAIIQESSRIPSEEIINAQKGIAKVIINRSKENADAIINSNDQVLERLDEIDETQNTKFTGISKDQRLKLTEMSNQTELKLQDMVVQLKDMELRLNQAILQGGKGVVTDPVKEEEDFALDDEVFMDEEPLIDEFDEKLVELDELALDAFSELDELEALVEEEPLMEEEPVAVAPEIDLSDPNKAMSPDDIAALFASMSGGDAKESAEPEILVEPEVEDIPPMPDLSDPNRSLSPDEIAALIANL